VSTDLLSRACALASEPGVDAVGVALVRTLLERAASLPPPARRRLLHRADALLVTYAARPAAHLDGRASAPRGDEDPWDAVLAARARDRPPPSCRVGAAPASVTAIRASAATARAADNVATGAGPYNGAAVASRALDELAAIAPVYLGCYVRWLEDLASLAELPERRATPRRP
jgi:hypothetical protein